MMRHWLCAWFLCLTLGAPAWATDVQEVTSPGGLRAWLVEDNAAPLVSISFSFPGGVDQDPSDRQGLSMLFAAMLTQGAGPLDRAAFQQALADHTVTLDFTADRDRLTGTLRFLIEDRSRAVGLARLALTHPRFDHEDFLRLRQQQLTAVQAMLDDPDWQARRAMLARLFPDHPYGRRARGSRTTLQAVTRDDMLAAQARLARAGLAVAVVGAIDTKTLAQLLDELFGELPASAHHMPIADMTPALDGGVMLLPRTGGQSVVYFALPGLRRDDPDWYAAEVLNYILGGGGFNARLMAQVRDQRGLTYGIGTDLVAMDHAALLLGQAKTDDTKAAEALQVIRTVIADLHRHGPTVDEVEAAKDYLVGSLPLSFTSTGALAGALLAAQHDGLSAQEFAHQSERLRAVDLTAVRRVAAKLLAPAQLTVTVVGMPAGLNAAHQSVLVED